MDTQWSITQLIILLIACVIFFCLGTWKSELAKLKISQVPDKVREALQHVDQRQVVIFGRKLYVLCVRLHAESLQYDLIVLVLAAVRWFVAKKGHADWTWQNDSFEIFHKFCDVLTVIAACDALISLTVTSPPSLVTELKEEIGKWKNKSPSQEDDHKGGNKD